MRFGIQKQIFKHKKQNKNLLNSSKAGHNTYAAETRLHRNKSIQPMRTVEMRIIRTIYGKARFDRIRNHDLLYQSNIQDIRKYMRRR